MSRILMLWRQLQYILKESVFLQLQIIPHIVGLLKESGVSMDSNCESSVVFCYISALELNDIGFALL
jgi:hypothetical protein